MSYFADDIPGIEPNMDDASFWDDCAQRQLRFQACGHCGTPRHPPQPICPKCQSFEQTRLDAPPEARVYTYTVVHHAGHPAVESRLPYVVAVVEFSALAGVRLVSNVTDVDTDKVHIGMPLRLWWDDIGGGRFVPRFRPAAT
jgi:uncharacterized protein